MTPHQADGASLIAAERLRQVSQEGYLPAHDQEHVSGELAAAAACYAIASTGCGLPDAVAAYWPHGWRFSPGGPVRTLVKAGALAAAEIDRLQGTGPQGARPAPELDLASHEMRPGELDATLATVPPCEAISSWGLRCRVIRAHEAHRDRDGNMWWPERELTAQAAPELAEVRRMVGEAIGEASMCWEPRPEGEFESTRAAGIVDRLVEAIGQLAAGPLTVQPAGDVKPAPGLAAALAELSALADDLARGEGPSRKETAQRIGAAIGRAGLPS